MGRLETLRVVLVDDDADTRDLLCFILKAEGAKLSCLPDAREALQSIEREPPDVLFSDISMPHLDGLAFIRKVRELPPEHGGRVPAAAITAHASGSSREKALGAGFQVYLVKPIEPETLVETVLRLARAHPAAEPAPSSGEG